MNIFQPAAAKVWKIVHEEKYGRATMDNFSQWAWGKDGTSCPISDLPNRWNLLHPDLIRIDPKSPILEGLDYMFDCFQQCLHTELSAMKHPISCLDMDP